MCLNSSKLFILFFKSGLVSLNQNFKSLWEMRLLEESQKPGGKRPSHSCICTLMLLCKVVTAFKFHVGFCLFNYSASLLRTQLFSLLALSCVLSTYRGPSAGQVVHGIFQVFQGALCAPMSLMPFLQYTYCWSYSYVLRNSEFSRPSPQHKLI